jgi:hypothetical protein
MPCTTRARSRARNRGNAMLYWPAHRAGRASRRPTSRPLSHADVVEIPTTSSLRWYRAKLTAAMRPVSPSPATTTRARPAVAGTVDLHRSHRTPPWRCRTRRQFSGPPLAPSHPPRHRLARPVRPGSHCRRRRCSSRTACIRRAVGWSRSTQQTRSQTHRWCAGCSVRPVPRSRHAAGARPRPRSRPRQRAPPPGMPVRLPEDQR